MGMSYRHVLSIALCSGCVAAAFSPMLHELLSKNTHHLQHSIIPAQSFGQAGCMIVMPNSCSTADFRPTCP